MVNRSLVLQKLAQFNKYYQILKSNKYSKEEFFSNEYVRSALMFNLFQAIQTCIDVGSHVIADENMVIPDTSADVFEVLRHHKTITPILARSMQKAVGVRNLIAHEYGKINLDKIYNVLKNDIKDLDAFCRAVVNKYKL